MPKDCKNERKNASASGLAPCVERASASASAAR